MTEHFEPIIGWADNGSLGRLAPTTTNDRALPSRLYQGRPVRNDMISIALIDEYSITRESICRSLQETCNILNVTAFSSSDQCLASDVRFDVILYHAYDNSAKHKTDDGSLVRIKQVLPLAPVIILCDADLFKLFSAAFDSGVRGYIPTESTSLEIAIEILYLLEAGGTFVPPSQPDSSCPSRITIGIERDVAGGITNAMSQFGSGSATAVTWGSAILRIAKVGLSALSRSS